MTLLYYGRHRKSNCDELGAGFEDDLDSFLGKCDIVTINVPLTDKTRRVFYFTAHARVCWCSFHALLGRQPLHQDVLCDPIR